MNPGECGETGGGGGEGARSLSRGARAGDGAGGRDREPGPGVRGERIEEREPGAGARGPGPGAGAGGRLSRGARLNQRGCGKASWENDTLIANRDGFALLSPSRQRKQVSPAYGDLGLWQDAGSSRQAHGTSGSAKPSRFADDGRIAEVGRRIRRRGALGGGGTSGSAPQARSRGAPGRGARRQGAGGRGSRAGERGPTGAARTPLSCGRASPC